MLLILVGTHVSAWPRAPATKQFLASCSKEHKPGVFRHTAMPVVEDVEKFIWEVERRPPLYKKI